MLWYFKALIYQSCDLAMLRSEKYPILLFSFFKDIKKMIKKSLKKPNKMAPKDELFWLKTSFCKLATLQSKYNFEGDTGCRAKPQ